MFNRTFEFGFSDVVPVFVNKQTQRACAWIFHTYTSTHNISNVQKVALTPVITISATGMRHMAIWHKVVTNTSTSTGVVFWPRYAALTQDEGS